MGTIGAENAAYPRLICPIRNRAMLYDGEDVGSDLDDKIKGQSVRCVREGA